MQSLEIRISRIPLALALAVGAFIAPAAARDYEDHYEFEASLDAPYRADAAHFRTFDMEFRFPGADEAGAFFMPGPDALPRRWLIGLTYSAFRPE